MKFKPAQTILKTLHVAEPYLDKPLGITKAEATHCIFNDLRVTRDNRDPLNTIKQIVGNRERKIIYDSHGDIIRYAGDILDYMVIANLLKVSHGYYYLNRSENEAILAFFDSKHSFDAFKYGISSSKDSVISISVQLEKGELSFVTENSISQSAIPQ